MSVSVAGGSVVSVSVARESVVLVPGKGGVVVSVFVSIVVTEKVDKMMRVELLKSLKG